MDLLSLRPDLLKQGGKGESAVLQTLEVTEINCFKTAPGVEY